MSQPTIPHQPVQPDNQPTIPHSPQVTLPHTVQPTRRALVASVVRPSAVPARAGSLPRHMPKPRVDVRGWIKLALVMMTAGTLLLCGVIGAGVVLVYSGGILPGVRVGGVPVGGMDEVQAVAAIRSAWEVVTLVDPLTGQTWNVQPAQIGIRIDAEASAQKAYAQGRGEGSFFSALGGDLVAPVITLDLNQTESGLHTLRPLIDMLPRNAGVQFSGGVVSERPAEDGRLLDVEATLALLRGGAAQALADGQLELVMYGVSPLVTSAGGMVEAARALLTQPLTVRVFDPVTGDIVPWQVMPETWAEWLIAEPDTGSATGLRLTFDPAPLTAYLQTQAGVLDSSRYLNYPQAVEQLQAALAVNSTTAAIRVYHHDRQHTVQTGETIISIAWDYGVPYPWVQRANGGTEALSVGQVVTIPSPDNFFKYEPIPDQRIVISISRQRAWVYENNALKWEWVVSTGIASSPTWTGVYQIISHVPNAYAGNWNLWMPYFLGVYQPIPGAEFTNGFHGFPTRGGGQLLWENSLGTRVTYGCILLNNTNAQLLYDWVREGAIVEIQP